MPQYYSDYDYWLLMQADQALYGDRPLVEDDEPDDRDEDEDAIEELTEQDFEDLRNEFS